MDKEHIYAAIWLNGEQLKLYQKINHAVCREIVQPAVVLYLRTDLDECLRRIQLRKRDYEQKITMQFLRQLEVGYENLLDRWNVCPVIRLSDPHLDFRKKDCVDEIAAKISYHTTVS
jgi:deoxyadenosine/deoxycytidine kinase